MTRKRRCTKTGDLFRPLIGQSIVVTGRLETMTRKQAWALLIELGAVIRSRVTRQTDLVLIGDKPGVNAKLAEQFGVIVICENDVLIGNLWDIRGRQKGTTLSNPGADGRSA